MKNVFIWLMVGSLWGCHGSTTTQHPPVVTPKDSVASTTIVAPSAQKEVKPPVKTIEIPYDATAGKKRALLAQEAYENPRDQRTYGADPKAKAKGKKLDCSYFVREVNSTAQSDKARKIKQQRGYLQPHELVKYDQFFTPKRLYANKLKSMSGKMADVLQKHGAYSTKVNDIRLGDYVFIGKGKTRNIQSIGHAMVVSKIDTINGHLRYYFIDAGYRGIKKVNGVIKRVKRSVRSGYYITHRGTVWSGKYIRYFKGTGRPR
ncbi:hypothetical protein [uncultured Microscilla sp.]|uniref:hypothetical protein n=1 Tax=uncultured Microscilla sp. TaxID=432653 RepID=UPI00263085F7|nr:hypothetical protein [uncultured Microscilla sp.]